MAAGPDGMLWVTESGTNRIARVSPSSFSITEFTVPTANSVPWGITPGTDGTLYFTESGPGKVGRITTSGLITEIALPNTGARPVGIATDAYGNVWVAEYGCNRVAVITPDYSVQEFNTPTSNSRPNGLAIGPDNAVWTTEAVGGKIFRIAGDSGGQSVLPDPVDASTTPVGTVGGQVVTQNGRQPDRGRSPDQQPVRLRSGRGGRARYAHEPRSEHRLPEGAAHHRRPVRQRCPGPGSHPDPGAAHLEQRHSRSPGSPSRPPGIRRATSTSSTSRWRAPSRPPGVYPWKLEIKATLSGGDVIDRTISGLAPVIANGSGDPYGPGWTIQGVDSLVTDSKGGVLWVSGSGDGRYFRAGTGGTYLSPANDFGTLVKNGNGTFTYTAKDQTVSQFNSQGKLVSVTDPQGLSRTFTYTGTRTELDHQSGRHRLRRSATPEGCSAASSRPAAAPTRSRTMERATSPR